MHGVDGTCVPMALKEDPQLNRATSVVEVLGTLSPSEKPDSQTDFSAPGQRHTIPKVQVSLSSSKRLALQVKDQSKCIQTGPQSIYKLKLMLVAEDKEKGVAKYRFGKPRPDTHEYVVMLVGATGAGKSTLINGMVNYIFGVDWEDDFRFKLIAEEGGTSYSKAHSRTTTTAYTIPRQQGSPFEHTLTIVDTPGLRDTKGLDSDKRIVEQIRTFFCMVGKKGIDHIDGIGFVTQAPIAQLTPAQSYVFDSILAVFGKDIRKNILMMATFADTPWQRPPVLKAADEAGIGYCKSFKFNNSALYTDQAGDGQEAEVVSSFDKMFWDMSMTSFNAFFKQLACMEARSLVLTKQVLEERKQLEVIMQSLQIQIQAILCKIGTLQQEEHIMEQHKADIAANKNFKYKVQEPRIVKHVTMPGQYVTNCTKCNFTCHRDCAYANNDDKRYCCAMSGEYCEVCKLKCHWSSHVNNPFWFEAQEVTVEKTYDELKERYEAALSGKSSKENIVSMIRAEIATSYHEVFLMIRQAQQILQRLDEIALRPNPLSEVEYIDLLVHTEEMDGGPGTAQRIKHLKSVREKAELMPTVKDDKIFEHRTLKQAQQLAKAEAEKVAWLKKAATSTWNACMEARSPDSQTDFSAPGQRHTIPKVQVSLSSSKRLALQVKDQSKCIQTGPQSIYKLKLMLVAEDKEKGVAKYQFGKQRPNTHEYVVMLVGATGAGKSTLINGMVNYIFGVDWEDDFRFKLIAEEGGTSYSKAHSRTTTTAYTIPRQQGSPFEHTLTIVDTPGFGDTKGLDSDKRIVEQIRTFFSLPGKKGIDHIDGIGFVTQAPIARLTPTQRYVFDSILAVFGKDIGKNILMMTTFADGKTPPVLEAVKEAGIGYCKSFKFNNSALYTDQAGDGLEAEVVTFDKMFWDMGMTSFNAFFKQLACMEARSLVLTKEVPEERKQLEVIIQSLPLQIKAILGKIGTLQQEEHIMEQHEADIAANKNVKYKVQEPRIVKHVTMPGQYVTNCTKCNFTCHRDCAYANNDDKRYCCAMSGEYCEVCKLKCHWSSHINNPFWFETQEVTVEITFNELKKRYEAALSGKLRQENIVSMIRAEIAMSYREVFLMIRQAQQILRRLDEIALHPNPLSEVEYIDLLIYSEEMDGGPGAAQRIKCLRSVREKAELMPTVKDDKIFEHAALKQAQQLAKGEVEKVGKKAAASIWSWLTE